MHVAHRLSRGDIRAFAEWYETMTDDVREKMLRNGAGGLPFSMLSRCGRPQFGCSLVPPAPMRLYLVFL